MLRQSLQQRMLQKLSPQQIQMIKLLEIPTMQLEQRIKKEMEENPALEEGSEEDYSDNKDDNEDESDSNNDEFSLEDYLNDEDIPSYKLVTKNHSADDEKREIPFSSGVSFHEQLETQLGLRLLSAEDKSLAQYIIGNIDEDGYLRRELEAIVDDLAFSMNISVDEEKLLYILKIIQDFDPPGVGARSLQECLLLQIEKKNSDQNSIKTAETILRKHFDEFTKKHYDKIIKRLSISEKEMKAAIEEILKLNPKPGSSFADPLNKSFQQIIPDFSLENNNGILQLSLNARNVPDLRVSTTYADMIEGYTSQKQKPTRQQKDAISFVKQKLDSAKWFIDAIRQRQNTLLVTMNAIISFQEEYFQEGDETKLRPMILKDIAEKTNLDISTISRVASSKYIQTNFGIFSLKYFFSEGMQTDSGEEVSTREIKSILQECIENEDKRIPVTDDKLTEILKEKGYVIARRTVAKYREQLHIPVARLRKEL